MFDFHLVFTNGITYDVKNVKEVDVEYHNTDRHLSGDDILSISYPLGGMRLHTPDGCIVIAGKDLLVVDILKRDI